jgi:nitroreductase
MTPLEPPEVVDVLRRLATERRSCRAYLPDPVPHDTIVELLSLAQRAASWCNTQPWEVTVTEGQGTDRFREALFAHANLPGSVRQPDIAMPPEYTGVHRQRRRQSGWQLYEAVGVARGDRSASAKQAMQNFRLFGAPHCVIVTVDTSLGAYGVLDVGLYVGTFLLAAESLGLGATAQAAVATYAPFIRSYFDIPPERAVLLGIAFGRPDPTHPANSFRTTRADLSDVTRWVDS